VVTGYGDDFEIEDELSVASSDGSPATSPHRSDKAAALHADSSSDSSLGDFNYTDASVLTSTAVKPAISTTALSSLSSAPSLFGNKSVSLSLALQDEDDYADDFDTQDDYDSGKSDLGASSASRSYADELDALYEFDGFEPAASPQPVKNLFKQQSFDRDQANVIGVNATHKGEARAALVPKLPVPRNPDPLPIRNWSAAQEAYIDELFGENLEDWQSVVAALNNPSLPLNSSLLWDGLFSELETKRTRRYKGNRALAADVALHSRHNRAVFDRINLLLQELYFRSHPQQGQEMRGTQRLSLGLQCPLTVESLKIHLTEILRDENQHCVVDVLCGRRAFTDHIRSSPLLESVESELQQYTKSLLNMIEEPAPAAPVPSESPSVQRKAEQLADQVLGMLFTDTAQWIKQLV
jgi:hypothetical protein